MTVRKLTRYKTLKEFTPGRGYTKEDWDEVSDNPELTDEEIANLRPFAEVFPELAATIKRPVGRPPMERPKKRIALRVDQDVLDRFKADGRGWQSRMNEVLRKSVGM